MKKPNDFPATSADFIFGYPSQPAYSWWWDRLVENISVVKFAFTGVKREASFDWGWDILGS